MSLTPNASKVNALTPPPGAGGRGENLVVLLVFHSRDFGGDYRIKGRGTFGYRLKAGMSTWGGCLGVPCKHFSTVMI